ncbi:CLUMA_CG002315, isoform A [Clunio marinus]|uniref:CLUMA_CG002315, isoform A n=1 Tax=Clunio marinus TaxID=568069 RepID=A0A1J1HKE0_9DIPT|nr:CLUMA_CG002315, isoform A [Clunio marinus]
MRWKILNYDIIRKVLMTSMMDNPINATTLTLGELLKLNVNEESYATKVCHKSYVNYHRQRTTSSLCHKLSIEQRAKIITSEPY